MGRAMSANFADTRVVVRQRVDSARTDGLTDPWQRLVCLTAAIAIGALAGLLGYLLAVLVTRILEVELAHELITLPGFALFGTFLGIIDVACWWRRTH
jgi:hypothetical protein